EIAVAPVEEPANVPVVEPVAEAPAAIAPPPEAEETYARDIESFGAPESYAAIVAPDPAAIPANGDHLTDLEVANALASLGPASSPQFDGVVSAEAHAEALASHGVEVYPRGHGSLVEQLYRTRWVAEEVPVDDATAALSLDREMQQAYARFDGSNDYAETAVAEAELAAPEVSEEGPFQASEETVSVAEAEAFAAEHASIFGISSPDTSYAPIAHEMEAISTAGFVEEAETSSYEPSPVEQHVEEVASVELASVEA